MSSSSQFETETQKEKHTQRTLDTHTTKTIGSFPRGCKAAHLPLCQPFSGRLGGRLGGSQSGEGSRGRNEGSRLVRKEVAPGPGWTGASACVQNLPQFAVLQKESHRQPPQGKA